MINNNDYRLESIVELKKLHPSKTIQWKIIRLGADIKIQSETKEDLYIMLSRKRFNKIIKEIIKY